jgi:hypothetical protein
VRADQRAGGKSGAETSRKEGKKESVRKKRRVYKTSTVALVGQQGEDWKISYGFNDQEVIGDLIKRHLGSTMEIK